MLDERKKKVCEANGIKLIYFAEKQFVNEENIITDKNELLNKILL